MSRDILKARRRSHQYIKVIASDHLSKNCRIAGPAPRIEFAQVEVSHHTRPHETEEARENQRTGADHSTVLKSVIAEIGLCACSCHLLVYCHPSCYGSTEEILVCGSDKTFW